MANCKNEQNCTCSATGNLVVKGGRVLAPQGFIDNGAVVIMSGRIAYVGEMASLPVSIPAVNSKDAVVIADLPVVDANGCIIAPGLLDVHTHGGGGSDATEGTVSALRTMAQAHGKHGTTGLLAATVTESFETDKQVARAVSEAMQLSLQADWNGAQVLGLHMEGPYLSAGKRGAQNADYMRPPSQAELEQIFAIIGTGLKHITLAPEQPGAIDVIRWLKERNVRVSLGHTEASYETALKAIEAGADHATHTFNAMMTLHHREPGVVGAVLGHDAVTAELIADGIHVHPGAMRVLYKAKGACLTCLVTDAIAAMDMPDGHYQLGEFPVEVVNGACRLENGSLAGSVLTLDKAVKNVVEMADVPVEEAIAMATSVPARQLGLSHRKGSLEVGKDGDLCIFGADLLCRNTVVAGRLLTR